MHDYLPNIDKCLKLYKKNKDITFMNIALYITDIYFFSLAIKDLNNIYKTNNLKNKIIKTLNDLISYNLNLNTVLNIIYSQFNYEK
jgi:hypothetical protein